MIERKKLIEVMEISKGMYWKTLSIGNLHDVKDITDIHKELFEKGTSKSELNEYLKNLTLDEILDIVVIVNLSLDREWGSKEENHEIYKKERAYVAEKLWDKDDAIEYLWGMELRLFEYLEEGLCILGQG